jgi:hypothetical protein
VADARDYSLDREERDEWDRLWGASTLRLIPCKCRLDLRTGFESLNLKVKAILLSPDPPEFAARIHRKSDCCPVCGESTAGCVRVAAQLTVEYDRPVDWPFKSDPTYWFAVWTHQECFEQCQETGRPAGIPW